MNHNEIINNLSHTKASLYSHEQQQTAGRCMSIALTAAGEDTNILSVMKYSNKRIIVTIQVEILMYNIIGYPPAQK